MFKYAIKDAFEEAVNNFQQKPPTLLSKFVDGKLKQSKGITEAQVEKVRSDEERSDEQCLYINPTPLFARFAYRRCWLR